MSKRIKLTEAQIASREEAEKVVGDICTQLNLQDQVELGLKAKVLALKADISKQVSECKQAIKSKMMLLKQWSVMNAKEFGDAKSIETVFGTFGFRTGNHKVELLKDWTENMVVDAMFKDEDEKEVRTEDGRTVRNIPKYIRVVYEVDREALIRDRKDIPEDTLKSWGVEILQDENFYVDPKQEAKSDTNLVLHAA